MKRFITFSLILLLYFASTQNADTAYNPFEPDVIKVTNTALANANIPQTDFNNFNTTAVINTDTDVFTSVDSDGVNCENGTYLVDVTLYQTSTSARANVLVEVTVDGTSTGIRGANAYIRNQNNHNESSTTVTDMVQLTSPGKIGFEIGELGNVAGNVVIPVGESSMVITRIKD